jgi:hypothetical protein
MSEGMARDGKPAPFRYRIGGAPSWASPTWRKDTVEGLRRLIAHVESSAYPGEKVVLSGRRPIIRRNEYHVVLGGDVAGAPALPAGFSGVLPTVGAVAMETDQQVVLHARVEPHGRQQQIPLHTVVVVGRELPLLRRFRPFRRMPRSRERRGLMEHEKCQDRRASHYSRSHIRLPSTSRIVAGMPAPWVPKISSIQRGPRGERWFRSANGLPIISGSSSWR